MHASTTTAAARALCWSRLTLLIGFAFALWVPIAAWLAGIKLPADFHEMRALAEWPQWEAVPLTERPAKFEAWLNDHFPLRGHVIRAHATVRHRWLGAPSANVIVGRDDWLFYTGDRTLEDLVGRDPLTAGELDRWRTALERRYEWLRAQGIAYLFVLVPNKPTIYPEQLPALLRTCVRPGKLDQLLEHLRARQSRVPVLDLRKPLRDLKEKRLAYWPADSHWTGHGLVTACDAIMRDLAARGVATDRRDIAPLLSFRSGVRLHDGIDLLAMRNRWPNPPVAELRLVRPPDLIAGESPLANVPPWSDAPAWKKPLVTERSSSTGRAVLFCDSFFRAGGVPLSELGQIPLMLQFQRFTSLWEWPDHAMLRQVVELEHPNVVIEARTERFLNVVPPKEP